MRAVKAWLRVFLSGIQAIAFVAPFVLHYFGSHSMGAHRHLKVRGDVYLGGILSDGNLTIAAILIAVLLVLLLCLFLAACKQRPQPKRLWSLVPIQLFTLLLFFLLVLPAVKAMLIFPWLLLCAALIWLLQITKMLLLDRQSFIALIRSCLTRTCPQELHHE